MGKKKQPKRKTTRGHNDVKTTKIRTHVWAFIKSCWFKKHFSEFIVTMFGVWAAFGLAGWGDQAALNKATEQRLVLAYLESKYNMSAAKGVLDMYTDANSLTIYLNRPISTAALVALQDTNVLECLPLAKVSQMKFYVDSINTLNQSLQLYEEVLRTQNYRITPLQDGARQKVHENAAAVLSVTHFLQKDLDEYADDRVFDREWMDKREDDFKYYKRQALKGNITLATEQTGQ